MEEQSFSKLNTEAFALSSMQVVYLLTHLTDIIAAVRGCLTLQ